MLTVSSVQNTSDMDEFVRFSWEIYREFPNWVPPLISGQKKELDKKRGAFFNDGFGSKAEYFLCRDGRKVVGRIAAIRNERHLARQKDGVGFFGFFECVDRLEVAKLLFEHAESWLREEGLSVSRGPTSFTINDTAGIMMKGQDIVPSFLMGYSPLYYAPLVEACGYRKTRDLLGYHLSMDELEEKLFSYDRYFDIAEEEGIEIRLIDKNKIESEAELIAEVFSESWDKNWGAFPLLPEELVAVVDELGPLFDERLGYVASVRGKPAGVFLAIPDPAGILRELDGKFGAKGLFTILKSKRKFRRIRLALMGTLPEFANLPISPLMIREIRNCRSDFPYLETVELFWILEENLPPKQLALAVGGVHTQTLRVFDKYI